jgi:hypothetical protein
LRGAADRRAAGTPAVQSCKVRSGSCRDARSQRAGVSVKQRVDATRGGAAWAVASAPTWACARAGDRGARVKSRCRARCAGDGGAAAASAGRTRIGVPGVARTP